MAYLSDFVNPESSGNVSISAPAEIYDLVNVEPPSAATIKITLKYLEHRVMQENSDPKKLE